MPTDSKLTETITAQARSLGASLVGVTSLQSLRESPSHLLYPKIGMRLDMPWGEQKEDAAPPEAAWPADAVSVVVIGVAHRADEPELDWWDGRGTAGNRILMRINAELSGWLERTFSIKTYPLPYFYEKGGLFLKDAAVLAGLGCIGKNNLVVTPDYGPRIRFRSLLLSREAEPTGELEFAPCERCDQPCRRACPVNAFADKVYSADALGQSLLPGIDGTYDRVTCNGKMEKDIDDAINGISPKDTQQQNLKTAVLKFEEAPGAQRKDTRESSCCVKFCRRCELSCPVGK